MKERRQEEYKGRSNKRTQEIRRCLGNYSTLLLKDKTVKERREDKRRGTEQKEQKENTWLLNTIKINKQ